MYMNVRIDMDLYECGNLHIYVDTSKSPNAGKGERWGAGVEYHFQEI